MNPIQVFQQDQDEKLKRKLEIDRAHREHNMTLTDDEKARLEILRENALKNDRTLSIVTTNYGGGSVSVNATEYFRMVDDIMETKDELKLLAHGEDSLLSGTLGVLTEMTETTKDSIRTLAVGEAMTEEELSKIASEVSAICRKALGRENIDSDSVTTFLAHKPASYFTETFPMEFISRFVDEDAIKSPMLVKNTLMEIIPMLIVTNDDIANLNTYLEYNERVLQVIQRLEECGHDLAKELKNPEKFATIVARTREETGNPDMRDIAKKYSDYFKTNCDGSYDYFAIRYVMQRELANAYETVKLEYINDDEIATVQEEIDEANAKADIYLDVANLTMFKEVYSAYESAAKADKRTSRNALYTQGRSYIDKIRKNRINLNFPGYRPDAKSSAEIQHTYVKYIETAVNAYNKQIAAANASGLTELSEIHCDIEVFAGVMLTVMARLLKRYSKNTSTKHESLAAHAYFKRFARFGIDIFTVSDMYEIVKPMVEYISSMKK